MESKISLCMIARNEEQNLRRCLKSVQGVVDEIIVVDTGSTDNTCQVAREAGAVVRSFIWNDNFSDARNASLEGATGEWILFLDADEELPRESCEVLRRLTSNEDVEGYFVKIVSLIGSEGWTETCPDLIFRLFRNRPEYRFRGAIHEQIADVILEKNPKAAYRIAEDFVIIHYGYLDSQISEKDKKNRNLKIIEKELEQEQGNRLLRYHYGVELYRAQRYEEAALELIRAANGIDPNTIYLPKLLRYIVLAYQSAAQPAQALNVALLGLKFFPNYADLYYYAGLLYLELKQYSSAYEYLLKAISMPEQPAQYASFAGIRGFRAYYHLGQIAQTFLDYEEALRFYIASISDNPNFIPALESMVRILNPRQNPQYTKECLEKVCEFCTPHANQAMAEIYLRQGAYGLALHYLEKSLDSSGVRLWRAICLIQERRYLEALRILEAYTRESEFYPLVKLNELIIFWLQGKKRKVRTLLAELHSLGLAQDTANVLSLIDSLQGKKEVSQVFLGQDGMALFLDILFRLLYMKELEKALDILNGVHAESLEPHLLTIAQAFYDYGQIEPAENLLRQYVEQRQDGKAYYLLAEICREKGSYLEAEQHYQRAIEFSPDEPRHYISLIRLYDEQRRQILDEALRKYPEAPVFKKLTGEVSATS
ncbi:glycosyltransferase family 2 protein [Zhaonella formicivorans]|uniref:glycosyltransferase family 2 protein n=1 Tax=Zhaonella formicivorans TaxID=2528593 RepID=UPI0010DA9CC8|nr:glycosyltransferase family 2 protein [Zhaonella formicivorans]